MDLRNLRDGQRSRTEVQSTVSIDVIGRIHRGHDF
jgi:hypothetical protein